MSGQTILTLLSSINEAPRRKQRGISDSGKENGSCVNSAANSEEYRILARKMVHALTPPQTIGNAHSVFNWIPQTLSALFCM